MIDSLKRLAPTRVAILFSVGLAVLSVIDVRAARVSQISRVLQPDEAASTLGRQDLPPCDAAIDDFPCNWGVCGNSQPCTGGTESCGASCTSTGVYDVICDSSASHKNVINCADRHDYNGCGFISGDDVHCSWDAVHLRCLCFGSPSTIPCAKMNAYYLSSCIPNGD
jgi:hypothetical protein